MTVHFRAVGYELLSGETVLSHYIDMKHHLFIPSPSTVLALFHLFATLCRTTPRRLARLPTRPVSRPYEPMLAARHLVTYPRRSMTSVCLSIFVC